MNLGLRKNAVSEWINSGKAWYLIEEKLMDDDYLLAWTVGKHYMKEGTKNIAESILHRLGRIDKPADYVENPLFKNDGFCPTEELLDPARKGTYLALPDFGIKNVLWIDKASGSIWKLVEKELTNAKMMGFDCEWKCNLTDYENQPTALLQVATETMVLIFDLVKLKKSAKFKTLMKEIFSNENIIKIGHTLVEDLERVNEAITDETAPFTAVSCLEVTQVYLQDYRARKAGLASMCQDLLKKPLSKYEQLSNWNKRPLRKAQQHYAGMDAFILLQIYKKFQNDLGSRFSEKYLTHYPQPIFPMYNMNPYGQFPEGGYYAGDNLMEYQRRLEIVTIPSESSEQPIGPIDSNNGSSGQSNVIQNIKSDINEFDEYFRMARDKPCDAEIEKNYLKVFDCKLLLV